MAIDLSKHYRKTNDLIAREIEGELVIVPLKSGIGNLDAEMYALSATGIAVWNLLDGQSTLEEIIKSLSEEYQASNEEIKADVIELLDELLSKGLIIER